MTVGFNIDDASLRNGIYEVVSSLWTDLDVDNGPATPFIPSRLASAFVLPVC